MSVLQFNFGETKDPLLSLSRGDYCHRDRCTDRSVMSCPRALIFNALLVSRTQLQGLVQSLMVPRPGGADFCCVSSQFVRVRGDRSPSGESHGARQMRPPSLETSSLYCIYLFTCECRTFINSVCELVGAVFNHGKSPGIIHMYY